MEMRTAITDEAMKKTTWKQSESISKIAWRNTFFELSDSAAAIINLKGMVILVNPAFEQLYGWTLVEIEGKYLPNVPDKLKKDFDEMIGNSLSWEKVIEQQTLRMKKDGTVIPVEFIMSPVYGESGKIKALLIVTKDLTELLEFKMLVEMQNEMIEVGEKLLLDITKNISEAFCLYDLKQRKPLFISPLLEERWEINIDEIYREPLNILKKFQDKDREMFLEFFIDSSPGAREMEFEIKGELYETPRWLRIEITPIVDERGVVARHISVFKDITELKEKTNQIKQLDKLGAVGQLAAGIAHEIRNPLTSVKGFVQLLAEETNSKYSQIITSEIERIEFIMNEFLVLAKPQQEMKLKNGNINDIVKDVISFMNPEALLHNVEICMDFNEAPQVYCESKQIKQVIINMIKNAIEAMPIGGTIHIRTATLPNGYATIEINDEGIGIAKERLKRLREPFYSNKEKGTGLGVMICYKIIEDHGGTIQFTSKEGQGTKVQIFLPPATASPKNKNTNNK
nr:ATP-binding protein [Bacillus sp. FJAT-50079]